MFPNRGDGPCYACLYNDEDELLGDCQGNGVLAPVPGVIGTLMAQEALKLVLGWDSALQIDYCSGTRSAATGRASRSSAIPSAWCVGRVSVRLARIVSAVTPARTLEFAPVGRNSKKNSHGAAIPSATHASARV